MFLDIFVLFVIVVSTLIAFMRGFVREALTIITIGLALSATYIGAPKLTPLMDIWMGVDPESETPQKLLGVVPLSLASVGASYASIFITLMVIFALASHFLSEFVRSLGLGSLDRSLGALFGLIRGALLVAILYMPMHFLLDKETKASWFEGSKSSAYLERSAVELAKFVPQDLIEQSRQAQAAQDSDEPVDARAALQSLNLLKDNLSEEEQKDLIMRTLEKTNLMDKMEDGGYSEDFREGLDQLIKQNAGEAN